MSVPDRIGKYEVVEIIGRGGFATVYKARDPLLKRFVAIKLCAPEGESLKRRFLREAEIAGTLDHPSIVRTFDCGFTDGGAYLVQEYLDGEDLRRKIRSKAPLPYSTRVGFLIELAQGLAYAHSKGVLHRDIKPGNVRVLASGRIKILDFGIGKLSSAHTVLTQEGTVLGTAGYLPPEQALGGEVDERADVFAFGALSYELLTYHQPFPGDRLVERIKSVLESTPEAISRFWPERPVALEGLVFRCLEKVPTSRYSGFATLISELCPIHQELVAAEERTTILAAPPPQLEAWLDSDLPTITSPSSTAPPATTDPPSPARDAPRGAAAVEAPPTRPVPKSAVGAPPVDEPVVAPLEAASSPGPSPASPGPPTSPARAQAAGVPSAKGGTGRLRPTALAMSLSTHRAPWLAAVAIAIAVLAVAALWSALRPGGPTEEALDPGGAATAPASDPPAPIPAAGPAGVLVVDAFPWGELVGLEDAQGRSVDIPAESGTPLRLDLPGGEYLVSVRRPGSSDEPSVCRVTIEPGTSSVCRVKLGRVAALEYFGAAGWWP